MLLELLRAGDAEAEHVQVVGAVLVEEDAVVPVVHAQIAAAGLALVDHLQAHDLGGEALPLSQVFDTQPDVTQLSHLDHCRVPSLQANDPLRTAMFLMSQ